ncbi:MAG: DNA mismatch repair endonuclease MutL [Acidobacteria bacterium]|nr:DNA mismatch repair endonuclease MutL [Acidobacteriota bacterium]
MGRIRVLPDNVVNRIAAGEVVERPASIVKELLENSLDAGARSVEVRVEEGGRRAIEVRDDGEGMDADDAIAALERHATSKIGSGSSLEEIPTLGFRGEALPSIAAVTRFTLTTSTDGVAGSRVVAEGGRHLASGPAAHPKGTTVRAADIFFNTPARLRFLRAPATEMAHLVEAVAALSLARIDVRFRFQHADRRILDLPPCRELAERLAQLEGPERARTAVPIRGERGGVSVSGFVIGGTGTGGGGRGARRFVVNGRVVKDRVLAGAASRALDEMLPRGSAASCHVILDLPHSQVDVNVHPAKAEVRFAEPGRVHDLVREAIRQGLAGAMSSRDAAVGRSAAFPPRPIGGTPGLEGLRTRVFEAASSYVTKAETPVRRFPSFVRESESPAGRTATPDEEIFTLQGSAPAVLGRYRNGYILAQDEMGLLLVDQHAAHETILYEQLMARAFDASAPPTQALMFPRTVTLPLASREAAERLPAELAPLGFDAEIFGADAILVRGVPAPLGDADPEALVLEILAETAVGDDRPVGIEERRRRMLATAACHAAVKVPGDLTTEKSIWILETLLKCRAPLRCPHGRPTILRWEHRAIERRFGRP